MTEIVRCPLRNIALASLLLGIGLASPCARADQRVGVDSAVNPAAMGIPPGALPRRLVLGQDVVFNERITTEAGGQTQILFVDESTLSVGPNANMVIDQFVYDPNTGAGKFAASLTRGVFRFVGGKLSKQDNAVTMRTPTATIGIRGGVMLVDLAADGKLSVYKVFGNSVTITGLNGVSQTITRNGFAVTVSRPGASPSDPAEPLPGASAAVNNQLDGRAGGNGGASIVPTEVMVANSGIANAISTNLAASIQAAAHTQPPAQQSQNVSPVVQLTQLNNQNVSVPGATVTPVGGGPSVSIAQLPTVPPGTLLAPPIVTPSPTVTPATTPLVITPPVITPPVITPAVVTPPVITPPVITPPVITPPVIPVVTPPVVTPPVVSPPVVTPLVSIAGVTGNLFMNGSLTPYTEGNVANGVFSANTASGPISFPVTAGSGFTSPDNTFFYADLTTGNQPTQRAFAYGGQPVKASFYQATSTSPSVLAFTLPAVSVSSFLSALPVGLQAGASSSPLYLATPANNTFSNAFGGTKALQASLAVIGTGPNQVSAIIVLVGSVFNASLNGTSQPQPILNGIIHGSLLASAAGQPIRIYSPYVTPADGKGNSFYGGSGISGFALSNGNCCGPGEVPANAFATDTATGTAVQYQFVVPAIVPATASVVPAGANTPQQNLTGYFGGIMTKEPGATIVSPIPYTLTGTANITTTAANGQVAATLNGTDTLTPSTSGITNGIVLGFGSTSTGATNARIAYVNDNLFAVMENPGAPSSVNNVPVPVTDGNSGSNIYLVTQTAAPLPASFLPGGVCSACTYLQWGYWGGELDSGSGSAARIDVGHINFWVAGQPTVNMPTGTGMYTGNAIGSVVNGSANYIASGGFTNTYNFARNTGNVAINNFDGNHNLSGMAMGSGNTYAATLSGTNGARLAGSLNGSFYGPTANETGGNFAFQSTTGTRYLASGIFAAPKIP
jgi:trimeric autotransporter adhesin